MDSRAQLRRADLGSADAQFLSVAAPNVQDFFNTYGGGKTFNFSQTYTAGQVMGSGVPAGLDPPTPMMGIVPFTAPQNAGGGIPQNTYNYIVRGDFNATSNTNSSSASWTTGKWISRVPYWGPWPTNMTGRNSFRGPGVWNVDLSVAKRFPIRERTNLEFRAEGFDVLNHHNLFLQEATNDVSSNSSGVDALGNPTPAILASKGGIGNTGGANDERRFLQFALKINF